MRPFLPDKPLLGSCLAALGDPPGPVLVAGSTRMARALRRVGFEVTEWQLEGDAGESPDRCRVRVAR